MSVVAWWRLRKRAGLLWLGFLVVLPHSAVVAQPAPVLGYVAAGNADPKRLESFRQGMTELGYVEGKNVEIDFREAVLDAEYYGVIGELIGKKVDIILAANIAAAIAAARTTSTIPIVMLAVNDPVGAGLVQSLEHPGTNVTGTTMYAPQLIGERLRILRRLLPKLDKISMLVNGNNPSNPAQLDAVRSEAGGLGIEVQALDIRKPEGVEAAFDQATAFGAVAVVNAVDSFVNSQRAALAAAAAKRRLPALYTDVEYVAAGGLMGLGPGHYEGYHDAASYVDKILRGAHPADLAVKGPTQLTFSVNRSALRKLGLSLPSDVAARVNDWIDGTP
jgi:putative ABC transport system substrate-binding protein